ncbi:hypothetical protein CsSME_00032115 [Camellia sinensis var. sinensis]
MFLLLILSPPPSSSSGKSSSPSVRRQIQGSDPLHPNAHMPLYDDLLLNGFATLLHQCLNSIKKGSAKEIALAAHAIGLLALTTGPGERAQEILEESVPPISQALMST